MASHFRRMRTYHPRRSSKTIKLNKQKLIDLEKTMQSDLGALLISLREGSLQQLQETSQKAQNDLLKIGPDMQKLASDIGGTIPKMVTDFLGTFHTLIDIANNKSPSSGTLSTDESKINSCYHAKQKLSKALGSV